MRFKVERRGLHGGGGNFMTDGEQQQHYSVMICYTCVRSANMQQTNQAPRPSLEDLILSVTRAVSSCWKYDSDRP